MVATDPTTLALVGDLFDTMRAARGMGLAAIQIGVPARVFVIDCSGAVEGGPTLAVCNPELVMSGERLRAEEGCLSFPGMYLQVARAEKARLSYDTPEGKREEIEAGGLVARVLLHELDHLNGVLFTDRVSAARRIVLAPRLRQFKRRFRKGETA